MQSNIQLFLPVFHVSSNFLCLSFSGFREKPEIIFNFFFKKNGSIKKSCKSVRRRPLESFVRSFLFFLFNKFVWKLPFWNINFLKNFYLLGFCGVQIIPFPFKTDTYSLKSIWWKSLIIIQKAKASLYVLKGPYQKPLSVRSKTLSWLGRFWGNLREREEWMEQYLLVKLKYIK